LINAPSHGVGRKTFIPWDDFSRPILSYAEL
jgi:hypothetical protein